MRQPFLQQVKIEQRGDHGSAGEHVGIADRHRAFPAASPAGELRLALVLVGGKPFAQIVAGA
ncbi:MAG: hypothetical protein ACREE1_01235, partial [Stellaceae bacterium]